MRNPVLVILAIIIGVGGIIAYSASFTVHQAQQALVLQFGNPVRPVPDAGLHFKYPFIQNVQFFDKRILDLDPQPQEVLLSDQKRIRVDSFARYKIVDPLEFLKTASNDQNFRQIFGNLVNSAVRAEVAKASLADMLSSKRAEVMGNIFSILKAQAPKFGVELVDLRIGRTDLPDATLQPVYQRMRSERIAEAAEIRAKGEEQKLTKQAEADRQRTVIFAEANRTSQILRGEGEGKKNQILGDAFGQDPEFFNFYRSMEAYENAFGDGTTIVLSPDSEFFRYFGHAQPKEKQ
ncbi:MAG: protease modulator HflC [Rhodospirillales bacterium]|jgi:modulator of FtsH protease HflC|nr:protease modulator HflC [Rhodospirillales bacterium]